MQLFACKLLKDWFAIRTKNGKSTFWEFFKIWFGKYSGMLTSVDWWELQKNFSHDLWIKPFKMSTIFCNVSQKVPDFRISSNRKQRKKSWKIVYTVAKQCRSPVNLTIFWIKNHVQIWCEFEIFFFNQLFKCQID